MSIKQNTTSLQEILNTINELPEGGSDPVLQDKTITPTTSTQTVTADSGYDGLDTVTVNAIPSTYVKPTTTKAATTYTPTTSNQTIAAGTYCSGAQTIKGDANLVAGNIKSGTSIFGVTGSYEGSGGSSGGSVETCTVTIKAAASSFRFDRIGYTAIDNSGNILANTITPSTDEVTIENVVCGSMLSCMKGQSLVSATSKVQMLYSNISYGCIFSITAPAGGNAIISVGGGGGSWD